MAIYGEDYNSIRRRNQSYFPSVNFPQAPGVAEGQARMDQLAATGTYKSRRDDFRNQYPQFVNPAAQQNLQRFDLNQAYAQGYGAPGPTIQQGAGGPYRVAGGVANPISNPPGFFQRQASNLYTGLTTAFPAIAQGLFGAGQAAYAGQGAGNQYANPGANATPGATPNTGSDSQYFAYNPSPLQPRRFDFNYF